MQIQKSTVRQLIVFFGLAFAIGWLAWLPMLNSGAGSKPGAFLYLFSPALAAIITVAVVNGWTGIRGVLARYLQWKVGLWWYVLAVGLMPAIFLVAAMILQAQRVGSLWVGSPWYFLIASFGFLIIINSGEEIGWRGFALSRLQSLLPNPLVASVALGVIWGIWHLPVYTDPRQSSFPLPLFLLFLIGQSIIYSVIFNRTRGSLLLAVLLHASTDFAPRIMNIGNFTVLAWAIVVILTWASALILYYMAGRVTPITERDRPSGG